MPGATRARWPEPDMGTAARHGPLLDCPPTCPPTCPQTCPAWNEAATDARTIPCRALPPVPSMSARKAADPLAVRLRASPGFVHAFTLDGRPYVAQETEPYAQYWLDERYRRLLSMFSVRRGATIGEAIDGYLRLAGRKPSATERTRALKAIEDMRGAGVLIGTRDDVSRYTARIVEDYLTHRPFPPEIAAFIVERAGIGSDTRVLDLAGGPGDLALQLARRSGAVTLMELSRGFIEAARTRAARQGLALTPLHESANRLVYQDDAYDVVTISQALHWLDDVLVCRGLLRVLQPGGSFMVIHSSMDLDDAHPLAFVLGDRSVLGHKQPGRFTDHVHALDRRLSLLFDALDAPDVHRVDPAQHWDGQAGTARPPRVVPAGITYFRQQRPYDIGYARAFLTPAHVAATGQPPEAFWRDLEARCAAASPAQLLGHQDWAVLHYRRGGAPVEAADAPVPPIPIGFERRRPD
jgi:2-polyprenyl-3-methyl-5-hydroxy-6-metoxy-1,4-benzoquinol methylase